MKRRALAVMMGCFSVMSSLYSLPASALPDALTMPTLSLSSAQDPTALSEEDIDRFTQAIAQIKDFYVQPINDKKLLEDAIRGMVSGLDPHSEYLDGEAYKTLIMTTSGEFSGLGIEVTGDLGVLKVISPMDGSPAANAGIKPGDYIVAINKKLVSEMTLNEAVSSMRGKKGTEIHLTVIRKDAQKPLEYKLVRDTIHIDSVKSKLLDSGYGYVRISEFQEPTAQKLTAAINSLKKSSNGTLKGLIIDLRNNPGGLLDSAVGVSNIFLDSQHLKTNDKLIVYTEGRLPNAQYRAKANSSDILNGAPIVILINNGSASASEIVAGALQDYGRAVIIGTPSFGKGSVQTILPLDPTHAIKLTTALYHTPSGRVIQNQGIIPDITVEDLKVENSLPNQSVLEPIHEFQLKNHLKNTTIDESLNPTKNVDLTPLAQSDFQLYQALKILKTLSFADQNKQISHR